MEKLDKPTVALSGCLLGEKIRYNGDHKRHSVVADSLNKIFNFKSFCPEVEMGLGVPRRPVRLIRKNNKIHIVDVEDSSIDHTNLAYQTFEKMAGELKDACGIILTGGSPSCGFEPIKVYDEATEQEWGEAKGLWSNYLEKKYPLIPKIDSCNLEKTHCLQTFLTQVFVFFEWKNINKSVSDLENFHKSSSYYFLLYGGTYFSKLEEMVGKMSAENFETIFAQYEDFLFQTVFKKTIERNDCLKVVSSLFDQIKGTITKDDKESLLKKRELFIKDQASLPQLLSMFEKMIDGHENNYLKKQNLFYLYSMIEKII